MCSIVTANHYKISTMVPLAPEQSTSEHGDAATAPSLDKTWSSMSDDLAEERIHLSHSQQPVDEQPNHVSSVSTSASEDDSSESPSSPSTTPVQWEAWSLPTETSGHFESATDLAYMSDGGCPLLTKASSSYDAAFATSPMLAGSMRSRMVSLPNLAEADGLAQRRARKEAAQKDTTTKYNKRPTPTPTPTMTSTASASAAAATPTSLEQLQIRTLQSEIDLLQSQLCRLQTSHNRAAKSSKRYKSQCRHLRTQLDESHSENVLLRREVTDLRTLVRLEEVARWRGALDALALEDARDRSATTPPAEVEIPVSPPKKDTEKTKTTAADVETSSLGVAMD